MAAAVLPPRAIRRDRPSLWAVGPQGAARASAQSAPRRHALVRPRWPRHARGVEASLCGEPEGPRVGLRGAAHGLAPHGRLPGLAPVVVQHVRRAQRRAPGVRFPGGGLEQNVEGPGQHLQAAGGHRGEEVAQEGLVGGPVPAGVGFVVHVGHEGPEDLRGGVQGEEAGVELPPEVRALRRGEHRAAKGRRLDEGPEGAEHDHVRVQVHHAVEG
eukprot:CAMPEP_0206032278 /NCGR_PEP_ID=MMETSP1464-20131121/48443_1 /ASSEMBLY_ACC=CAM_ASM_001124 /TAXON_ID=119497 /ORGANISM="Exanthemachrysis gayraliae, Strain RCC1523" /LENGTH=213 /DNA_ID=CAMNT_0053406391 /DNA_START=398 /DNA_END=1039 /DNA_ORIENTATION=-